MPPVKQKEIGQRKKKTRGNVNNTKGMKTCKRSIISGARMSITPSNFVHQVITRSRAKILNQLKDNCLISDLLNIKNEFSFRNKPKRKVKPIDLMVKGTEAAITISDDEMEINSVDNNVETTVFPSTSSQHVSPHNLHQTSYITIENKDIVTNASNSSHSEKMEITENFCTNEPRSVLHISQVSENISKINNEHTESNFERILNLDSQSPNDQFSLNNCDNKENEMKNIRTGEKDIVSLMTQEIWKKKQLYHLQEDILRMENKKLGTLKWIFKKWYEYIFFKNKTDMDNH